MKKKFCHVGLTPLREEQRYVVRLDVVTASARKVVWLALRLLVFRACVRHTRHIHGGDGVRL